MRRLAVAALSCAALLPSLFVFVTPVYAAGVGTYYGNDAIFTVASGVDDGWGTFGVYPQPCRLIGSSGTLTFTLDAGMQFTVETYGDDAGGVFMASTEIGTFGPGTDSTSAVNGPMSNAGAGGTVTIGPKTAGGRDLCVRAVVISAYAAPTPTPTPTPTPSPSPTPTPTAAATPWPTAMPAPTPGVSSAGWPVFNEATGAYVNERGPESWGLGFPSCGGGHGTGNANIASLGLATVTLWCDWTAQGTGAPVGDLFRDVDANVQAVRVTNATGTVKGRMNTGGIQLGMLPMPPSSDAITLLKTVVYLSYDVWCLECVWNPGAAEVHVNISFFDRYGTLTRTVLGSSGITVAPGGSGSVDAVASVTSSDAYYALWIMSDNGQQIVGPAPPANSPTQLTTPSWQTSITQADTYFANASQAGALTPGAECGGPGQAACSTSGNLVPPPKECGPLSGDCSKKLLPLQPVPQCFTPDSALDVPGWLSYIGCELAVVGLNITNAVTTLANVVIDVLEPGQAVETTMSQWGLHWQTEAPFSWIGGAYQYAQDVMNGAHTSDSSGTTLDVFGRSVNVTIGGSNPFAQYASEFAPYRGMLTLIVWLWFGIAVLRLVASFFHAESAVPET